MTILLPENLTLFLTPALTPWLQGYDPAHHWWLSTFWAALPLVVLLAAMIGFRLKGHISALIALALALVITVGIFHMPVNLAVLSTILGAGYGLFPIFWIVFPVIFMYQLTVRTGRFGLLQECLVGVTEDSRLQLLLIAFICGIYAEIWAGRAGVPQDPIEWHEFVANIASWGFVILTAWRLLLDPSRRKAR